MSILIFSQVLSQLQTDSWKTPDLLLTDSWPTPDWLLTDSKKLILNSQFQELSQWALQIWRALLMSSPSFKLIWKGFLRRQKHPRIPPPPYGIPNRPLMDTQREPLIDPQTDPRMECLTDTWETIRWLPGKTLTDSKKLIIRSQFGELAQWALQIWRAVAMSSPNLELIWKGRQTDPLWTPDEPRVLKMVSQIGLSKYALQK